MFSHKPHSWVVYREYETFYNEVSSQNLYIVPLLYRSPYSHPIIYTTYKSPLIGGPYNKITPCHYDRRPAKPEPGDNRLFKGVRGSLSPAWLSLGDAALSGWHVSVISLADDTVVWRET